MPTRQFRAITMLLAATSLAPFAAAQAAQCPAGVAALPVGSVADVAPGAARSYSLNLGANEGVIIDLSSLKPLAASTASHGDSEGEGDSHAHAPATTAHTL